MTPKLKLSQLNYLLDEFPEQHGFISRLDMLINGRNSSLELLMQDTIDILQPTDIRTFVLILKSVEKTNLVEYAIQVNDSHGEKIQDFSTITDIPEVMFDPHTQTEFRVLLTDIMAKYTFHSPHQNKPKMKI